MLFLKASTPSVVGSPAGEYVKLAISASGTTAGVAGAATGGAGAAGQAAGGAAWTQSPTGLNVLAGEGAASVQPTGLLSKFTSSPYFAPAVVQAGGAVLQGIGQAKAAQAQIDAQQKLKDDDLKRYNTNIGTRLWGAAPTGG